MTTPWLFLHKEPKANANVFGERGKQSPMNTCERPCKQQSNTKGMKLAVRNELLESFNDEIGAKRAGHRKARCQKYCLPSLDSQRHDGVTDTGMTYDDSFISASDYAAHCQMQFQELK